MSASNAVTFSFNPDTHEYGIEGVEHVPSCTAAIAAGGLISYRFVEYEVLERKALLGHEVHLACHLHNLDRLGAVDPRVQPYLNAWIMFKQSAKSFRLISSEYQCVASLNGMPYGMQLDCNAQIDRDDTVIELKTGMIYPHAGVQMAGYAAGLPHPKYTAPLARFMSRKRIVVELRSNGVPKVHRYEDRSDYDVFAALLYVVAFKKRHAQIYKENR